MSDDLVYAVNNQGETVQIPRAQVADAKAQGFTAASPDQVAQFQRARTLGTGLGNEAKAFGAGALRSASFGTSDALLSSSGLAKQDTLAGLQEFNPGASTAGEIAGVVGSAFVPGSAVSGVSKLGSAVETGAAKLLPQGTGLASRLVAKAGSRAAGSAVEGAVYGLGHVVSEQALGDPNLTAQKVAQEVGLSALFGGGLGALTGVAEVGIPAMVQGARAASKKVDELARGLISKSERGAELLSNSDMLASLSPEAQAATGKSLTKAIEEQTAASKEIGVRFNKELKPLETEQFMAEVNPAKAQEAFAGAAQKVTDAAAAMRAEAEQFGPQMAGRVEKLAMRLEKATGEDALGSYKALDAVNKELFDIKDALRGDMARGGKTTLKPAFDVIDALHKDLKGTLEDASVWGQAGASHAQVNGAVSDLYKYEKQFRKYFGSMVAGEWKPDAGKIESFVKNVNSPANIKKLEVFQEYQSRLGAFHDQVERVAGNVNADVDKAGLDSLVNRSSEFVATAKKQAHSAELMGPPGSESGLAMKAAEHLPVVGGLVKAGKVIASAPGQVKTLIALERAAQAVDRHLDAAVSTLIRGGVKASKIGRGEAAAGLAGVFGRGPDAQERSFKSRVDEVSKLNDPEALVDKLAAATGPIQNHAPLTAAGIQATGARAAQFLASKVPSNKMPGIIPQEWKPTPAEIAKFNRYYEAVKAPASILKQAAAGTLTIEAVEAVKTVYPELYEHMQGKIIDSLSTAKNVPYQSRMSLAMLLGQDVDGSTSPHMIQANTAIYMGKGGAKQMGMPAPKPMGVGAAKGLEPHAGRFLTAQQKSSQR